MESIYFLSIIPITLYVFRWTWWQKDIKGLPVLVYHKIGEPPKDSKLKELWVSEKKFEKQIIWLNKNGYKTLLFSELLAIYNKKEELKGNEILITFDDGYENNYKYAYPILKNNGAKGNIFIVFNTIAKTNIWHNPATEPWINMANKDMILEMDKSGVIEFGSHTMNHPKLDKIPIEDAKWEIEESKRQIEKLLNKNICAFAYPYGLGAYNSEIRKLVLDAGYTFDFSFKQGKTYWPWERDKFPIDRLFIRKNDKIFELYLHIKKGYAKIF